MRITILFHTSPRVAGGGTKVLYEYANYLTHKGHTVEIAYMANQLWSRFGLPEPIRKILARLSVYYRPRWFKLDKKIRKYALFSVNNKSVHDADVIVATDVRTAKPVAGLNQKKGEKYYFIQGFENWVLSNEDVYMTYALGMHNITVAGWLSKMVDQYSSEKSICIPNSINTSLFCVKNSIEQRNPHSLAFHYRSNPVKGCEYAFETIRILEKKYHDLIVTVVGIENEPDDMPKSCKYVHHAKPSEVADINNNVAVFMCTSVIEGFGLPGLEAMACGCALVSTDCLGIHEYAEDGKTALISRIKDAEGMARNIERFFDDNELRIRFAKTGALEASKRSTEKSAEKFERVICGY